MGTESHAALIAELAAERQQIARLRTALRQIEARAGSAADGNQHGPWSAGFLRGVAQEIRDAAHAALKGDGGG